LCHTLSMICYIILPNEYTSDLLLTFFFLTILRTPRSTLFPYTTLFRSRDLVHPRHRCGHGLFAVVRGAISGGPARSRTAVGGDEGGVEGLRRGDPRPRKHRDCGPAVPPVERTAVEPRPRADRRHRHRVCDAHRVDPPTGATHGIRPGGVLAEAPATACGSGSGGAAAREGRVGAVAEVRRPPRPPDLDHHDRRAPRSLRGSGAAQGQWRPRKRARARPVRSPRWPRGPG